MLNQAGLLTATHQTWTQERVTHVRKQAGIPTGCPYFTPAPGPRGDGLLSAREAAARLGTTASMVAYWFRQGLLVGHHRRQQTALWVRLTDEEVSRLDGSSQLQPQMEPLPEVLAALHLTPEQLRAEIQADHWLPYRLRVNNRWRWYLLRRSTDA